MNEQIARRSVALFRSGFFCAESVLQAIAESLGIHSEMIPRIASGFCSGMARTGGQCGAVSGAMMGLGLSTGRDSPAQSLEPGYAMVQELIRQFEAEFGTVNCRELIDCDLATEAGQRHFIEHELMERCYRYSEAATKIAVTLMDEQ